eukprot:15446182-Heterocapsa_arctica.AAC.1
MAASGVLHHWAAPGRPLSEGSSHLARHATTLGAKSRPEEGSQNRGVPDARAEHEATCPAQKMDGHDG